MSRAAIILILLLVTAGGVQAQHGVVADRIVATVNGEPVRMSAFEQKYKAYLAQTGAPDSRRLRTAVLSQIVNDRLIVADGRNRGLVSSSEYEQFVDAARYKFLVESFLADAVLDTVRVSEAEVEDAFIRINTEIEARHLFAHSREAAEQLYERLMAGESFEALAREVFADTILANNGGSLDTFTFDEMDPDFEDAAFRLQIGEISPPVRTAQGYSIIQVTDRFTKPLLTEAEFAQKKNQLHLLVLRKKQIQVRSQFLRDISDRLDPVFEAGFDRLLGQLLGMSIVSDEQMDALLNEPLVSFTNTAGDRDTWTVGQFREKAEHTSSDQRAQVRTEAHLKDFVTGLVARAEIIRMATARELDERPEFVAALEAAADDWILQKQKERLVAEVAVPVDSVRAHYARCPNEFTADDGTPLSYEQAQPRIVRQLHLAYTRESTLEYVADLRRAAEIEVDERLLGQFQIASRDHAAYEGATAPSGEMKETVDGASEARR